MKNINIIYWSGTGNTEKMANLINDGIKEAGNNGKLIDVANASANDVTSCDILLLGSPSMGDEVIEESEMEPFVESISSLVSGKTVGLFGSYGWGDGQWMRDFVERMEGYGANLIDEGLIVNSEPDDASSIECINYGKNLK